MPLKTIKRVFIANRGEIARRIASTCRLMGIESVALTDRKTPPAYLKDVVTHFVHVAEENTALYLDAKMMIAFAKQSSSDAVHPGFGFLSENAEFAEAVIKNGLTWVGPNPAAISAMASKATARERAKAAGVPCIEGLHGLDPTSQAKSEWLTRLTSFASATGYPLLVKAAFGGGGKGMRLVYKDAELEDAATRAASEAKNSFGNPSLVVERYLESPRHVEVQVLADKHGHAYAIGDRDCSLQRRHQKIIEEAPAPWLSDATRKAMQECAANLAAAVGYDSTGTVEFLVDAHDASANWQNPASLQRFYFLEMNTRLQVEHPVTEEVFGLDLVEWQLRVARGEVLPAEFAALPPQGHAIEARFYAEDAVHSFFPAPGPVFAFEPAQGPGVRWELGLDPVDEITTRFDPMIAKIIVTAATRAGACEKLADVLERSFFAGKASNRDLLYWLVTACDFRTGPVTTHFLQENAETFSGYHHKEREKHRAQAHATIDAIRRKHGGGLPSAAWHSSVTTGTPQHLILTAEAFATASSSSAPPDNIQEIFQRTWAGMLAGKSTKVVSGQAMDRPSGLAFWYALARLQGGETHTCVAVNGWHFGESLAPKRLDSFGEGAATASEIASTVPGKVVAVKCAEGDIVSAGQAIVILESMKMEFEVKASSAGSIGKLYVKVGEQVIAGQILASLD